MLTTPELTRPGWRQVSGKPYYCSWRHETKVALLAVFGGPNDGLGWAASVTLDARRATPEAAAEAAERMNSDLLTMEVVRRIVGQLVAHPQVTDRIHDDDCDACDECAARRCGRLDHLDRDGTERCTCLLDLVRELVAAVDGGAR